MTRIFRAAFLAAISMALAGAALARENHALLVGASEYVNLDERYWLVGPANDVDLVRRFLLRNETVPFGPGNITVLADGVEGGTAPTLAAIRDGIGALTRRVGSGDFVYLHFSGHGTQAPARDPDSELDGLDELFLPVDIGPWNDTTGEVENALVDDELGQMIAGLRATGATVWAVFDSCHSGTVTRAAPGGEDIRMRKLGPAALGMREELIEDAQPRTRSVDPRAQDAPPLDTAPGEGGFIAFYAAQSNEPTPEKRLPRGKKGRRAQGVFTYTLFEALAANPGITYRQLGQEVLRRYATERRAKSTPMFVGDLDAPVFGSGEGGPVRQWPLDAGEAGMTLPAGRLHGLDEGTELAVVASPADPDDAVIGKVRVTRVDNFTADLVALASDGTEARGLSDLPEGAYARKLTEALEFGMRVALPDPMPEGMQRALDHARDADLVPARIVLVAPGAEADLRIGAVPDGSALLILDDSGLTGTGGQPPRITLAGKDDETLALVLIDTLNRMARVQNLLKMSGSFAPGNLRVETVLQTRGPDTPRLRALDPVPVPRLIPDDEVHIRARNEEDFPVDLNVLYVGSDRSITHMFKGRLHPEDELKQGLLRITDSAFGRDRVILLMTPARPHTPVADFGFLAQDELPPTRAVADPGFAGMLAEAGFGETTRAAVPLGAPEADAPRPAILQFEIDTRP